MARVVWQVSRNLSFLDLARLVIMQYKRVQKIIPFLISATIASHYIQINGTPFVTRLTDSLASTAESCIDIVLSARYANTAFTEETLSKSKSRMTIPYKSIPRCTTIAVMDCFGEPKVRLGPGCLTLSGRGTRAAYPTGVAIGMVGSLRLLPICTTDKPLR
jgi:hypothetical protein